MHGVTVMRSKSSKFTRYDAMAHIPNLIATPTILSIYANRSSLPPGRTFSMLALGSHGTRVTSVGFNLTVSSPLCGVFTP